MEQSNQTPAQPVAVASAPTHVAAHSKVPDVEYESNPFRAAISGLVTILKANPMSALLLMLLIIVGAVGAAIVLVILGQISDLLGVIFGLALVLGILPITIGAYSALAVSSIKNESHKTMDYVKMAAAKFFPVLGAMILIGLCVALGFILLIVPGIIFAVWFSMTFNAMFDEDLGVIAAMKRSKELVSGHFLEVFNSNIVSGFLGGDNGLLAPVIGLAPITGRYHQLKALKASGKPKPAVHWMNYVVIVVAVIFIGLVIAYYTVLANKLKDLNTNSNDPFGTQQDLNDLDLNNTYPYENYQLDLE